MARLFWAWKGTIRRASSKTAIFQTVGELSCQVFEEEPPLRISLTTTSRASMFVRSEFFHSIESYYSRKMPLSRSHCFKNAFANRPVIMFSSCHCVTSLLEDFFFSHTLNVLQNWPRLRTSCSCCSEENIIIFGCCVLALFPCILRWWNFDRSFRS